MAEDASDKNEGLTQNQIDEQNCAVEVKAALDKYRCEVRPLIALTKTQSPNGAAFWTTVVNGFEVSKLPPMIALAGDASAAAAVQKALGNGRFKPVK